MKTFVEGGYNLLWVSKLNPLPKGFNCWYDINIPYWYCRKNKWFHAIGFSIYRLHGEIGFDYRRKLVNA